MYLWCHSPAWPPRLRDAQPQRDTSLDLHGLRLGFTERAAGTGSDTGVVAHTPERPRASGQPSRRPSLTLSGAAAAGPQALAGPVALRWAAQVTQPSLRFRGPQATGIRPPGLGPREDQRGPAAGRRPGGTASRPSPSGAGEVSEGPAGAADGPHSWGLSLTPARPPQGGLSWGFRTWWWPLGAVCGPGRPL